MQKIILIISLGLFFFLGLTYEGFAVTSDVNVRDTTEVKMNANPENQNLSNFVGPLMDFFYVPVAGGDAFQNVFIGIAGGVKNIFIALAVIFLIIGVLKLLFAGGDEERQKKWKNNIIWVSIGIFVMQIAYSFWRTLYLQDPLASVDGRLGWMIWVNLFEPIVGLLLLFASFAFMAMAVYAFYTIITGGGDEEKLKKGKNIIIYSLVGFLLIRIPKYLVTAIYGEPTKECKNVMFAIGNCMIDGKNLDAGVSIFGKILVYVNGFIALFAVVMTIYAGWLVFISGGDEEKLKKAKSIILYIAIGVIALFATQALFRFFFLRGA